MGSLARLLPSSSLLSTTCLISILVSFVVAALMVATLLLRQGSIILPTLQFQMAACNNVKGAMQFRAGADNNTKRATPQMLRRQVQAKKRATPQMLRRQVRMKKRATP